MADTYQRSRGSSFAIGTTAASAAGDTYTPIEGCKVVGGQVGKSFASVDGTLITDEFGQPLKGLAQGGTLELQILAKGDPADVSGYDLAPGQAALKAAVDDLADPDNIYNFRWTKSSGRLVYIKAKAMSLVVAPGAPTDFVMLRSQLAVMAQFSEAAPA